MSKTVKIALIAAAATIAAGCSSGTSTPANTPSPSRSGHVGDKFTIDSGRGKYDVQLLSVDQMAQPDNEVSAAKAGHHLAAAQFRVTAITNTDENSNLNAGVTGSNEQSYEPAITSGVAAGTNFASGSIKLQPRASLIGWVPFEVPDGVHVTRVHWNSSAGGSSDRAEWEVNRSVSGSPTPGTSPTGGAPAPAPGNPGVDPANVVIAYFDAINRHDFRTAWELGGKNIAGGSYSNFVAGHRNTLMDGGRIVSVTGGPAHGTVTAAFVSLDADGTTRDFRGTYTVENGVITRASVRQVGHEPGVPAPVPPPGHSPEPPEHSPGPTEPSPAPTTTTPTEPSPAPSPAPTETTSAPADTSPAG